MEVKVGAPKFKENGSAEMVGEAYPKGVESKLEMKVCDNGPSLDLIWSKEVPYPLPIILYFHSDSLISADSKKGRPVSWYLAKRGYMVINVSLQPVTENLGIEEELNDILSIFQWISKNSEKYKMDSSTIYVTGSLYGGLVSLWSAVLFDTLRIRKFFNVPDLGIHIKGVGLFCGLSDPNALLNKLVRPFPKALKKTLRNNPDLASCLRLWDNHDIRTMPPLFQTCSESSTTYPDATKLNELMEINAVPHELLVFPSNEGSTGTFMELYPHSKYSTRAISKMLNLFQTDQ